MIFEKCGLKFNVREGSRDRKIINTCLKRDKYSYWNLGEPYTGIVLDVGAHVGGFTCAVAQQAKHVFAIEPDQDNMDCLIENLALNNLTNVTVLQAAVGKDIDLTGILDWVNDFAGTKEIELLKIDCEGCEYELLMGTRRDLVRNFKLIASEIHTHPKWAHMELINYIVSLGYRVDVHPSRAESAKMANFWRT